MLETRRLALGQEDVDLLTSMAVIYENQDKRKESERIRDRTVYMMGHELGHEHPKTVASMVDLAQIHRVVALWPSYR